MFKHGFLIVVLIAFLAGCSNPELQSAETVSTQVQTSSQGPTLDAETVSTLQTSERIRHTFSDGTAMSLFAVGDHVFAVGTDMALSRREDLPQFISAYEEHLGGALGTQGVGFTPGGTNVNGKPNQWPSGLEKGIIYYTVDKFPSQLRPYIDQAINEWNATSVAIKWRPKPTSSSWKEYKYATIKWSDGFSIPEFIVKGIVCDSLAGLAGGLGYQDNGLGFPVGGTIYMNPDCLSNFLRNPAGFKATLQHEMGHIVGLWHEQQRCDRDNYVRVTGSAPAWDLAYYFNFGKRCEKNIKDYGPYDFNALMGYDYQTGTPTITTTVDYQQRSSFPYLTYCGEPGDAGSALGLSSGDIYTINTMYGKPTARSLCGVATHPANATVKSGRAIRINAYVNGYNLSGGDRALSWRATSGSVVNLLFGYIYVAPNVSRTTRVTLTATSVRDPEKSATISVLVKP